MILLVGGGPIPSKVGRVSGKHAGKNIWYGRRLRNEDLLREIEDVDLSGHIASMLYGFGEEEIPGKESVTLISEMVSVL